MTDVGTVRFKVGADADVSSFQRATESLNRLRQGSIELQKSFNTLRTGFGVLRRDLQQVNGLTNLRTGLSKTETTLRNFNTQLSRTGSHTKFRREIQADISAVRKLEETQKRLNQSFAGRKSDRGATGRGRAEGVANSDSGRSIQSLDQQAKQLSQTLTIARRNVLTFKQSLATRQHLTNFATSIRLITTRHKEMNAQFRKTAPLTQFNALIRRSAQAIATFRQSTTAVGQQVESQLISPMLRTRQAADQVASSLRVVKTEARSIPRVPVSTARGLGGAVGVPVGAVPSGRRVSRSTRAVRDHSEALRDLSAIAVLGAGPLSGLGARIIALGGIADRSGVGIATLAIGLGTLLFGVEALRRSFITLTTEFNALDKRLLAIGGSATVAGEEFQFILDLSRRAGAGVTELGNAFSKILISTKAAGLTSAETRESFEDLTLAFANMGLTVEQSGRALRAFDQILSKGTVQAEEITGQLGDVLPGILQIGAKAYGQSVREFRKNIEEGRVSSIEFFKRIAPEIRDAFGAGNLDSIESFSASLGRLNTEFKLFASNLTTQTGTTGLFQRTVDGLSSAFFSLGNNIDVIADGFKSLLTASIAFGAFRYLPRLFAGLSADMGRLGLVLSASVARWGAIGIAIGTAQHAVRGFRAAMLGLVRLFPLIGAGLAIVGVAATTFLNAQANRVQSEADRIDDIIDNLRQRQKEFQERSFLIGVEDSDITASIRGVEALRERVENLDGALVFARQNLQALNQGQTGDDFGFNYLGGEDNTQAFEKANDRYINLLLARSKANAAYAVSVKFLNLQEETRRNNEIVRGREALAGLARRRDAYSEETIAIRNGTTEYLKFREAQQKAAIEYKREVDSQVEANKITIKQAKEAIDLFDELQRQRQKAREANFISARRDRIIDLSLLTNTASNNGSRFDNEEARRLVSQQREIRRVTEEAYATYGELTDEAQKEIQRLTEYHERYNNALRETAELSAQIASNNALQKLQDTANLAVLPTGARQAEEGRIARRDFISRLDSRLSNDPRFSGRRDGDSARDAERNQQIREYDRGIANQRGASIADLAANNNDRLSDIRFRTSTIGADLSPFGIQEANRVRQQRKDIDDTYKSTLALTNSKEMAKEASDALKDAYNAENNALRENAVLQSQRGTSDVLRDLGTRAGRLNRGVFDPDGDRREDARNQFLRQQRDRLENGGEFDNDPAGLTAQLNELAKAYDRVTKAQLDNQGRINYQREITDGVVKAFDDLTDSIAKAVVEFRFSADSIANIMRNLAQTIIAESIKLAIVRPIVGGLFGAFGVPLPTGYNEGGLVRGAGGIDRNLVRVSDGEFIVNARDTARYREQLEAINSGKAPASVAPAFTGYTGGSSGGKGGATVINLSQYITQNQGEDSQDFANRNAVTTARLLQGTIKKEVKTQIETQTPLSKLG